MNERNIFLTGKPGAGKTTLIRQLVKDTNKRAGGFFTREMRRGSIRVGFKIETFGDTSGVLAHIDIQSDKRVGKYRVDVDALNTIGVTSIYNAIDNAELIVIDEIGKMELCSVEFKQAVMDALQAEQPLLGTIMMGDTIFTREIRRRTDVRIYKITPENWDKMHKELKQELLDLYPD